jgi:hypothetical protein
MQINYTTNLAFFQVTNNWVTVQRMGKEGKETH